RRGVHRRGQLLPDAHRRRAVPAERRHSHRPPGRNPREHPGLPLSTFLGMPYAPRGVGHLRGEEPFPVAARAALADTQLRRNLGRATSTIRAKRAAVVAEVDDWEALREAGAQIKDRTLRHLDVWLERLEASVQRAGGTVHWARDGAEACAIVAQVARAHGSDE